MTIIDLDFHVTPLRPSAFPKFLSKVRVIEMNVMVVKGVHELTIIEM